VPPRSGSHRFCDPLDARRRRRIVPQQPHRPREFFNADYRQPDCLWNWLVPGRLPLRPQFKRNLPDYGRRFCKIPIVFRLAETTSGICRVFRAPLRVLSVAKLTSIKHLYQRRHSLLQLCQAKSQCRFLSHCVPIQMRSGILKTTFWVSSWALWRGL
jgi:hypothetical protein